MIGLAVREAMKALDLRYRDEDPGVKELKVE
jgi:hypothetical protein